MGVSNVEYKTISFTRSDGIDVELKVTLIDPFNLDENFLVLNVSKINNPKEVALFYWIDIKRWTLNEFNFFALNNNLCLEIKDKQSTLLASYGICGNRNRIFNNKFSTVFN